MQFLSSCYIFAFAVCSHGLKISFDEVDTSDGARGGLKVHWVEGESAGHCRYYEDFKAALAHHPEMSVCAGSFDKCKTSDVVFLGHDSTTKEKGLKNSYKVVMAALKSKRLNNDTKLAIFFNKEWIEWDEKMKLIKNLASAFPKTVVFTHSARADEWSEKYELHFVYVPFGVDFKTFDLSKGSTPFSKRKYDLFFSGNANPHDYPLRLDIINNFTHMKKQGIGIYGAHAGKTKYRQIPDKEYREVIRNTKMSFATPGEGELMMVGTRYYEMMASGTTLLLVQRVDDSKYAHVGDSTYAQLGIKEDVNVVMFSNVSEFIDKVKYYKDHAEEAMKIITSAQELTRNNHTWGHRAQQVFDAMKSL